MPFPILTAVSIRCLHKIIHIIEYYLLMMRLIIHQRKNRIYEENYDIILSDSIMKENMQYKMHMKC